MNALQGTIKNGHINESRPTLGMCEEDWPTTPEGIAALLARMEQVEPGWLSSEDDAAWRAAIRAHNESEKTDFGPQHNHTRSRE